MSVDTETLVYCRYCLTPLTRLPVRDGVAYVDSTTLGSIMSAHVCEVISE